jgi:hypothetical protein
MYVGEELQLLTFLISALDGGECLASRIAYYIRQEMASGSDSKRNTACLVAGVDTVGRTEFSASSENTD